MSSGHRDYDYLEWIARLTSHIPERGTQLVLTVRAHPNVPVTPSSNGAAIAMYMGCRDIAVLTSG